MSGALIQLSDNSTVVAAHVHGWDPVKPSGRQDGRQPSGWVLRVMTASGTITLTAQDAKVLYADVQRLRDGIAEFYQPGVFVDVEA